MALLLMTFADFKQHKLGAGLTGLILSIGLVVYDMTSSGPVSSLWNGDVAAADVGVVIKDLVLYLVSISAGLEFRLALSGGNRKTQKTATQTLKTPVVEKNELGNGSMDLFL